MYLPKEPYSALQESNKGAYIIRLNIFRTRRYRGRLLLVGLLAVIVDSLAKSLCRSN